jgi:hypothetical protein
MSDKEFNFAEAREDSIKSLVDMLLTHPVTGSETFAIEAYEGEDEKGARNVSVVCVEDIDSEEAVIHTIYTGLATKKSEEDIAKEMAAIESAKSQANIISMPQGLVDVDGQPLK